MNRTEAWFNSLSGPLFRVGAATFVTIAIVTLFSASFFVFRLSDRLVEPLPYTEKALESFGPFAAPVDTGLFIRDFSKFDIVNRDFEMNATVWFSFNPAETSISSVEHFEFINGTIEYKSTPDLQMIDDRLFVWYEVKVKFRSELDYRFFPYEAHRVSIILTNPFVTPHEMILRTQDTSLRLSPLLLLENWHIKEQKTDYGYSVAQFDEKHERLQTTSPEAVFSLLVVPAGAKNVFVIFVPLLFALLLSLFSLLIPYRFDDTSGNALMFSLASASVASILAYRFVIETIMPRVGYMTTTDYVFGLSVLASMIIFLVHVIFFLILMQRMLRLKRQHRKDESSGDALAMKVNIAAAMLFFIISVSTIVALYVVLVW